MKLTVEHFQIKSTHLVDTIIEERVIALQPRVEIEEARVRLERRHEQSPSYRVAVHLVTPGPDLKAEGRDHTIRAAIDKVMQELEQKVSLKQDRRIRRTRSNLQGPALSRAGNHRH